MAEPFKFSPEERTNILQTAIMAAGPDANAAAVSAAVSRVAFLMSPGSLAPSVITEVERRFEGVEDWKFITGTILHVDREITSSRGIIVTKTEANNYNNMTGQELVRTEMTKWDDIAKSLAISAAHSIGQRVTMLVAVKKMQNGNKVRVVSDMVFRGPDDNFQPEPVRWDVLGGGGKQFDVSKLASFQPVQQQTQQPAQGQPTPQMMHG